MEKIQVYIDGKKTRLNAKDFLKFALETRTAKRKPLEEIEK